VSERWGWDAHACRYLAVAHCRPHLAEQARNHTLDLTLSGSEVKDARKVMDDAAFRRDRLQAALEKLRKRLARLKYQEEHARRQVSYDKAQAVRDELAKELANLYPTFVQKLVELLVRIDRLHQQSRFAKRCRPPAGC
jgi:hypothetical protein